MALKYALTVDQIAMLVFIDGEANEPSVWSIDLEDGDKWFKMRGNFGDDIDWKSFEVYVTEDGDVHRISLEHGVHERTPMKQVLDPTLFSRYKHKYGHLCRAFTRMDDG